MPDTHGDWAERSFALLVGVERYRDPEIPFILGPEADVDAMRRILVGRCGFDPSSHHIIVRKQEDAIRERILEDLKELTERAKNAGSGARLFFYFSGHGDIVPGLSLSTCLLLYDTKMKLVAETSLTGDILSKYLLRSGISQTLMILDCCLAEGVDITANWHASETRGEDVFGALFAARATEGAQPARANDEEGEGSSYLSLFTKHLVDVVDDSGEDSLSFSALENLIRERMTNPEQHPRPWTIGSGDELLVRIQGPRRPLPTPSDVGCVLVVSETERHRLSAERDGNVVEQVSDAVRGFPDLGDRPLVVYVDDAVQSHAAFDEALESLCRVPVAIFDVTGFEPAIMLLLGIRSVARRGVTLLTTADDTEVNRLETMPFNLIIARRYEHLKRLNRPDPVMTLRSAIREGLRDLAEFGQHYLDLPVYDAVRLLGTKPEDYKLIPMSEKILALCPFDPFYRYRDRGDSHYDTIKRGISEYFGKTLTVTLDSSSPRLVTQDLYDAIRRCELCVVDWTGWRANVFFELGVRLASSSEFTVNLIDKEHADFIGADVNPAWREEPAVTPMSKERIEQLRYTDRQRPGLLQMFRPHEYTRAAPIISFEKVHDAFKQAKHSEYPPESGMLRRNHVFDRIMHYFEWSTEAGLAPPHIELIRAAKMIRGGKSETEGEETVLFSGKQAYVDEVRKIAEERVLAAWFYLDGRFSMEQIDQDEDRQYHWVDLAQQAAAILGHGTEQERKRADDIDDRLYEHKEWKEAYERRIRQGR